MGEPCSDKKISEKKNRRKESDSKTMNKDQRRMLERAFNHPKDGIIILKFRAASKKDRIHSTKVERNFSRSVKVSLKVNIGLDQFAKMAANLEVADI